MKKILYISFIFSLLIYSCSTEGGFDGNPLDPADDATLSDIANLRVEPRVGAAVLKWDVPADSSFTYVEIRYNRNGTEVIEKASRYTDSLLVEGLIEKEPTSFGVTVVIDNDTEKIYGGRIITDPVVSIRRQPEITYFPDELTQIEVTADMLDTFTQEQTEGPKESLVDGNPSTFWHSAWSSGVAPLPHWIQVNFDEPQEIGVFKYYHRQGSAEGNRPTHWEVQTSEDGENWSTAWSNSNALSTSESEEHTVSLGKNVDSQYYRFVITATPNNGSFTYLGEISFFKMRSDVVDKEKEAEKEYYSF